jgi:hypothetical protein
LITNEGLAFPDPNDFVLVATTKNDSDTIRARLL